MDQLSEQQQVQEEQYRFPYHYLDVALDIYRRVRFLDYLSNLRAIKELAGPFTGQRLLDAGCGDGRFCHELRDQNVSVVGVDYSERALAFARAFNPHAEFRVADLANLTWTGEFDRVTLIEVLEHIRPSDVAATAAGLARAMKRDGLLIVSAPSTNLPVSPKHYQHFTAATLAQALAPTFAPVRIIGHSRAGKPGRRFIRRKKWMELLWPMRFKLPLAQRAIRRFEAFYRREVEFCQPDQAARLIGVFRRAE